MRNIYIIEKSHFVNNNLYLSLNEKQNRIQIQPAGQMLADSDNVAFIYVVEEEASYSYLKIPQDYWSYLVPLLNTQTNPILLINDQEIELINFTDELTMLLLNIEGNDNYGNFFVETVEREFSAFYKKQNE